MIALAGSKSPLPARDERGSSLRLSSRGGGLAQIRRQTAWHESGHIVASRALDFPISFATIEPNKWFSGRCLAPLSQADDSPEQQIAAAQAICDQARALIGNTLGQDPLEFAGWRTHVHARCMILAAGTCAEQLSFPGIAPLNNGTDKTLSRIYAESICALVAVPAFLEYVRQEATALLVSQRHVLEALADALEARRTLDTMAIDVVIAAAVCKADKGQEKAHREVWNRKLESAAAFRQEVEIVSGI